MKNVFFIIAMSSVLVACNNSKTESQVDETITTVSRIDDHYSNAIKELNEDYTKMSLPNLMKWYLTQLKSILILQNQ